MERTRNARKTSTEEITNKSDTCTSGDDYCRWMPLIIDATIAFVRTPCCQPNVDDDEDDPEDDDGEVIAECMIATT